MGRFPDGMRRKLDSLTRKRAKKNSGSNSGPTKATSIEPATIGRPPGKRRSNSSNLFEWFQSIHAFKYPISDPGEKPGRDVRMVELITVWPEAVMIEWKVTPSSSSMLS